MSRHFYFPVSLPQEKESGASHSWTEHCGGEGNLCSRWRSNPDFPVVQTVAWSLYWLRYLGVCNFARVWSCEHCERCACCLPSRFETGGFLWLSTVSWRCVLCKEMIIYEYIWAVGGEQWGEELLVLGSAQKGKRPQNASAAKSGCIRRRRQKSSLSPSQLSSTDLQPNFFLTAPHTPTPWSKKSGYYTLADLTNMHRKYKHNGLKHILL